MFLNKHRKKIILFKEDNPEISIAIVAAIILLIVGLVFIRFIEFDSGLSQNLFASLLGFFFDVLLFGILIVLINKRREEKLDIKRWLEEISDYSGWDEKEATFRIVGNIRRLNNMGVTTIFLRNCFLKSAVLERAKLMRSNLDGANLENAYLVWANLENAYLAVANLSGARLLGANLKNVNAIGANLMGANFSWANLMGADLRRANLRNADLYDADLRGADLERAFLEGALLNGVNFQGANISWIEDLAIAQLALVKTLYMAEMDPDLEKEVRDNYPHLLEKPKNEEEDPESVDNEAEGTKAPSA